jgi:hypothetical protein
MSGTGVPPVVSLNTEHGRDARATVSKEISSRKGRQKFSRPIPVDLITVGPT